MIPRDSNGRVDTARNIDKWTVASTIGDYDGAERSWWALDPRYDVENPHYDDPNHHAKDRSDLFDNFEDALAYALKMARGDAE